MGSGSTLEAVFDHVLHTSMFTLLIYLTEKDIDSHTDTQTVTQTHTHTRKQTANS